MKVLPLPGNWLVFFTCSDDHLKCKVRFFLHDFARSNESLLFFFCRMKLFCARGSQPTCWSMTSWRKRTLLYPWTKLHLHPLPLRVLKMMDQWTVKHEWLNRINKQNIMDDIYILIARSDSVKFYRNTSLITRIALWDFFISLKVGTSFFIIIDSVTAKYCSIAIWKVTV